MELYLWRDPDPEGSALTRSNDPTTARRVQMLKGHPNVITMLEMFTIDRFHCIGLELAGADLASHLKAEYPVGCCPVAVAHSYGAQLFRGLAHLREHGVVHNDIKLENLLLDQSRERLMIGDFGISRVLESEDECFTGVCGTMAYVAPELLGEKAYGFPIDIWAAGVCLFVLLVGEFPFRTES
jgi:calcium/calmodulin-dependent protein kinase I